MTDAMRLAAKAVSILVIVILFAIIWFLISVEFTSSENIVLDRFDDKCVSFCSTSDDIGSHGQSMDIEVNEKKYQGIRITEVIPTDTFVGTNRVYIYCTDLPDVEKGSTATLYNRYSSLIEYILANYALNES